MIKYLCFVDGEIGINIRNICKDFAEKQDLTFNFIVIDANYGFTNCKEIIDTIKSYPYECMVLTNQIGILSHEYGWREDLSEHERIFLFIDGNFINIQNLTDKELRKAHNIEKMYIANAFNN